MTQSLGELLLSTILIVGSVVGYIPQYFEIRSTRRTEGFSSLVCFILLISNILRIFFWVGKRFETTLLIQSIVMIAAQILLLELIVQINGSRVPKSRARESTFLSNVSDLKQFWSWNRFLEYLTFMVVFTGFVGSITMINALTIRSKSLTEIIGTLALVIEAALGMPQAYRNFVTHSAGGLRPELLLCWFVGDGFKTFLFIYRSSPVQFIACGIIQLAVDCIIAFQMFVLYRNKTPRQRIIISNNSTQDSSNVPVPKQKFASKIYATNPAHLKLSKDRQSYHDESVVSHDEFLAAHHDQSLLFTDDPLLAHDKSSPQQNPSTDYHDNSLNYKESPLPAFPLHPNGQLVQHNQL